MEASGGQDQRQTKDFQVRPPHVLLCCILLALQNHVCIKKHDEWDTSEQPRHKNISVWAQADPQFVINTYSTLQTKCYTEIVNGTHLNLKYRPVIEIRKFKYDRSSNIRHGTSTEKSATGEPPKLHLQLENNTWWKLKCWNPTSFPPSERTSAQF